MPTAGMVRDYHCAAVARPRTRMRAAARSCTRARAVGDLVVFRLNEERHARRRRAAAAARARRRAACTARRCPCARAGCSSVVSHDEAEVVFCGGGDGTIRKLTGCDMRWQLARRRASTGAWRRCSARSTAAPAARRHRRGADVPAALRRHVVPLVPLQAPSSHTTPLTCVAFIRQPSRSDVFATGERRRLRARVGPLRLLDDRERARARRGRRALHRVGRRLRARRRVGRAHPLLRRGTRGACGSSRTRTARRTSVATSLATHVDAKARVPKSPSRRRARPRARATGGRSRRAR